MMKEYLLYYISPFYLPGMQLQWLLGQKPLCDHEGGRPMLETQQQSATTLSS